ncbi:restriction endonuclease subunit S [Lactobacillus johnsonii]|uniref:restriction endonuclease subunit S n=1 Tax=Lactobacillus johnsonii TaxID=33959 RepID=UPI001F37852F|nr:restriction endonuclease subunit S [Lactobacillus johnsonii]MCF0083495.1 restriction endonuclease subunit S [Lactobacillus johnsonii]MCT3323280.1 type I restriction endonuclease subunit S [Lactobacillus johnsonii]
MEVSLKEISKIVTGNTPSKKNKNYWNSKDICFIKPDVIGSGIDSITTSNEYISNSASSKARIVDRNTILITCIGNIGRIGIISDKKVAFNQQINAIIPNYKINIRYLAYVLLFSQPRLNALANSAVVPIVNKTQLGNFKVKINPNLESQGKIVSILDKIAKIIKKQTKEIEHLDELIKARFVEMFGEFPYNEKGWNIGTIRDLVSDVRYGTSKKASENNDGKYPYLRMNNITYDGKLDLRDLKSIDIPEKDLEKYSVKKDDILFNRTNSRELVGKTCVYTIPETMILAGFIIRVRLNELANPLFVSTFLNTDYSKQLFKTICKNASGQSNINATELQKIKIYIPPLSLQNKFANFVQQVDKSKVAVQKSLDETQKLYDSLMQEYFG